MAKRLLAPISIIMLLGIAAAGSALWSSVHAAGNLEPLAFLPIIINPAEAPDQPAWLAYVNQFRTASSLGELQEEVTWSEGARLHSRYMVKNDVISHSEEPSNPWYTPEGAEAGDRGNIFVSSSAQTTFETAVNWWMGAPFHAVALLDPQLELTGFGAYTETAVSGSVPDWQMGATIDVERGRTDQTAGLTFPIFYPPNNGSTQLTRLSTGEFPDPLTSCPGYSSPVGAPLIIQLGDGNTAVTVTDSSLQQDGVQIPHCTVDENSYSNDSPTTQQTGRIILDLRDAVILIPRDPLQAGSVYTATVTNNNTTYSWSFTVETAASIVPTGANIRGGTP